MNNLFWVPSTNCQSHSQLRRDSRTIFIVSQEPLGPGCCCGCVVFFLLWFGYWELRSKEKTGRGRRGGGGIEEGRKEEGREKYCPRSTPWEFWNTPCSRLWLTCDVGVLLVSIAVNKWNFVEWSLHIIHAILDPESPSLLCMTADEKSSGKPCLRFVSVKNNKCLWLVHSSSPKSRWTCGVK